MIRVDTQGLREQMKPLGFAKETLKLEEDWKAGNTAVTKDADTDIPLHLPGFESSRFKSLWSQINKFLLEKQYGKCAYCEAKMAATSSADVEHFRPKAGYDPATGGIESAMLGARGLVKSGYFWLAYNSSNYYAACRVCNEVYKKNKFDLMPDSPRATYNSPAVELPAFIDPGAEDPRVVLRYDPYTARAVPAPLWDEYIKRKGKEDPLATPVAKVKGPLPQQQQSDKVDELNMMLAVLWNAAKDVCRAAKANESEYFFTDQVSRLAGVAAHDKTFDSDSPYGPKPYEHFSPVPDEIMRKGPGDAITWICIVWLHEVDPQSPKFTLLTDYIAQKELNVPAQAAVTARALVMETQKMWTVPFAHQVLTQNKEVGRAVYSIVHLGLNRTELIRARAQHLTRIRGLFLFLKNNGLLRGALEQWIQEWFGKAPPETISLDPNELDAAATALHYAVSNAGEFASLTVDALSVWRLELPEAVSTPHQILTSVSAPAEPWLARYHAIILLPMRPDTEDDDEGSDDEDGAEDPSADDPTMAKLTRADCGYLCALQLFGVKLSTLRSRFGLNVEEGDLLTSTVLRHSLKKDPEVEALYLAEVRRLLAFYAQPADIVESSFIPVWASGDIRGYWEYVDTNCGNTNKELETAYEELLKRKKPVYEAVVADKKNLLVWWRKAYPKKRTLHPKLV